MLCAGLYMSTRTLFDPLVLFDGWSLQLFSIAGSIDHHILVRPGSRVHTGISKDSRLDANWIHVPCSPITVRTREELRWVEIIISHHPVITYYRRLIRQHITTHRSSSSVEDFHPLHTCGLMRHFVCHVTCHSSLRDGFPAVPFSSLLPSAPSSRDPPALLLSSRT